MKLPKALFLFLAGARCWMCPGPVEAQFYAPDTEYHDPVQRVAVVEMARVLAWLVNVKEPAITEISYQVTTKPDQSTTWDIRWLNAAGKAAKSATVSYPAATLKEGPEFYRSIFKQLWLAGWKSLPAMKANEVSEKFWQGAAQMGLSREESLERAFKLVSKEAASTEDQWVPRLAGLLVHTSLPGMSDRVTLDGVVLARGAAWLALAENVSSSKLDGLWATVLFQAGRESLAARLWQKEFPAKLEHPTPEEAGWNIWLRKPTSKEIFLFASESTNLPIALPMLAYDVTVNQTGRLLAEVLAELVPSPKDSIRLHNYASLLADRTSIGGGHLMNGAWPVCGRAHWIRLLSEYPASSMDYTGYVDSLRLLTNSLSRISKPDPDLDASLTGFSEVAPLLRLAHKEGVGALAPASVATARDLLNYGWEMAALQMGARHHFVAHSWGVRSQAEPIFKSVTTELEGVMPFFLRSAEAKTYNYKESLARLQMVDGFFQRVGWNPHPFDTKGSDLDSARLFVKRSWLRPRDFEWQARTLWDAKGVTDIPELANALREEGGCHAAVPILNYLVSLGASAQREIPGADDLKVALAETLTQPSNLYVRAVYDRKFKNLENFERAQTIERLYWQNPDSGLEDRVFRNYVVVNALTSAKRFYTQARENILDPVGFSNGMGKTAYMVGYVLNDQSVRKMALEDSRSASYSDMVINIWDAAVRDDLKELEQTLRELVDRYEEDKGANSQGRQLLKFLPLVPALQDPRSSSRQEALRFSGKSESWVALRWIWIEEFKLPAEDAIALLGGRENDLFRRVLICYLEKDPAKTLEALNAFSASRAYIDEKTALSTYLYYSLRKNLPKRDESDLKPDGVVSTRQAVLAKLKSKGN